jgi:hypothetical protein
MMSNKSGGYLMLTHITLNLARNTQFPDGSTEHGYEMVAPLDEAQHLDASAWKEARELCTVRRFWAGEDDKHGYLVHRAGGRGGAHWTITYGQPAEGDDEVGYHLESRAIRVGEYLSVVDSPSKVYTLKVVSVRPFFASEESWSTRTETGVSQVPTGLPAA